MAKARLSVKAFLEDGTKLSKVIYFDVKTVKQERILKEFDTFLQNLLLRNLQLEKK